MNNWSDLAGDEGGGMGGGVGRWPMEGGQGGEMGGAPESSVGATKKCTGSPFWAPLKTNNWSDLAADEGGGGDGGKRGEVAHGGRARGEMGGGAPESSVGATKAALVPPFGLP